MRSAREHVPAAAERTIDFVLARERDGLGDGVLVRIRLGVAAGYEPDREVTNACRIRPLAMRVRFAQPRMPSGIHGDDHLAALQWGLSQPAAARNWAAAPTSGRPWPKQAVSNSRWLSDAKLCRAIAGSSAAGCGPSEVMCAAASPANRTP